MQKAECVKKWSIVTEITDKNENYFLLSKKMFKLKGKRTKKVRIVIRTL